MEIKGGKYPTDDVKLTSFNNHDGGSERDAENNSVHAVHAKERRRNGSTEEANGTAPDGTVPTTRTSATDICPRDYLSKPGSSKPGPLIPTLTLTLTHTVV